MSKTVRIPLVHCIIHRAKQTTSIAAVPEYEARLIREVWAGQIRANAAKVEIVKVPEAERKYIESELETEYDRLSTKFAKNPTEPQDRLFGRVYPGDAFDRIFKAIVNDQPEPAPEPLESTAQEAAAPKPVDVSQSELIPVDGINDALAELIENELEIFTVAELAEVSVDRLAEIKGIGPKSAARILKSAKELSLQDVDLLE